MAVREGVMKFFGRHRNVLLLGGVLIWTVFLFLIKSVVLNRHRSNYLDYYMYKKRDAIQHVQVNLFFDGKTTSVKQAANSSVIPITTGKALSDNKLYHPDVILANNAICDRKLELLVYIQSHWGNFMRRRILRNTWASKNTFTKVNIAAVFILGRPEKKDDQIKINNEQLINGDIIEGDVLESHQNISQKSKIAMKWIHTHCSNTKYVLKTDDDIFINIFELLEHILPTIDSSKNVIACHIKESGSSVIVRNKNSKWYVPEHFFPNMTHFPRFCTGYAVVMTTTLVHELYKVSQNTPALPVDDVYTFGVLTQPIKDIKFVNLEDRFTLSQDKGVKAYSEGDTKAFVAVSAPKAGAMEDLWSYTLLDLSTWARNRTQIAIRD